LENTEFDVEKGFRLKLGDGGDEVELVDHAAGKRHAVDVVDYSLVGQAVGTSNQVIIGLPARLNSQHFFIGCVPDAEVEERLAVEQGAVHPQSWIVYTVGIVPVFAADQRKLGEIVAIRQRIPLRAGAGVG